ncbi:hypothetical protein OCS38_002055 [Salmonella enterica]|nr:hypothetical protein [Salmonella enterica]
MPALSPAQSNIPTWFTEGDKNKGISWIGQDWLNILQAELLNILSEAGIKPDKGKLNQLTLSIKAIITANAYTQANNLKEIFDAGIAAQAAARSHLGLGRLATKDSLGPADVNALAKDQNLKEIADKGEQAQSAAREHIGLGNSATRNVGTTPGTVAAGDDSRITGAMQKDQNGADILDKPDFIKNVGLKETLNPTKRVSIGNIGTGAFDGSTPSINIGDSDSGFIGSADGVLDIYCNNAKVGYINNSGLHMLADIFTTGSLHAGANTIAADGNIYGTLWGGWLNNWLNSQLTARDNNINTRATWDWVKQYFVQDVRLTAPVEYSERGLNERVWGGVVTSWADYGSSNYHIKWRLLQKFVNGQWLTVAYA